ncbi:unnamed protein product [Owenia fusiformis]|uniref:Uncharacterized protein n=1 Tax=Owenia fusiformis TaxID=6347 RepID=A0A8S4N0R2_OWEFU|nr:unnamed protein product [Owenia fusiformis]
MSTRILMNTVMMREDEAKKIAQNSVPSTSVSNKAKRQRLDEIKRGVANWKRVESLAKAHWKTYKPNTHDGEAKQRNFMLKPLDTLPSKPLKLSSKVLNKVTSSLNENSSDSPMNIERSLRNLSRSTSTWQGGEEKTPILQNDTFSNRFALNNSLYNEDRIKKRIKRICLNDHGVVNETRPPDEGVRSKMTSSFSSSYANSSQHGQINKRKYQSKVSCHFQSNNGTVDVIKPIKLDSLSSGRRFRDINESMQFDGDFIQREKTFAMMKRVDGMLETNPDIVAVNRDQPEQWIDTCSTACSDFISSAIDIAVQSDFDEYDTIDKQLPPERQFTFVRTFSDNASYVMFHNYLRELPDKFRPIKTCQEWLDVHVDINEVSHLILE